MIIEPPSSSGYSWRRMKEMMSAPYRVFLFTSSRLIMALPPLVKEFQRLVGVDHDLATVLGYGLGDDVVLVILRLLVGAMEQLADTIKAKDQTTVRFHNLSSPT